MVSPRGRCHLRREDTAVSSSVSVLYEEMSGRAGSSAAHTHARARTHTYTPISAMASSHARKFRSDGGDEPHSVASLSAQDAGDAAAQNIARENRAARRRMVATIVPLGRCRQRCTSPWPLSLLSGHVTPLRGRSAQEGAHGLHSASVAHMCTWRESDGGISDQPGRARERRAGLPARVHVGIPTLDLS